MVIFISAYELLANAASISMIRIMRRLKNVDTTWSSRLAYAIGLIASDGNLSPDGRHINLTSKDIEIIVLFKEALCLKNKIGRKGRGYTKEKKYYCIQFGDKNFYDFLLTIGLMPAKSKTLGPLRIPSIFFRDFLRGCIDGDGNINVSRHPESRHLQLRMRIYSASKPFLEWIHCEVLGSVPVFGGWIQSGDGAFHLAYGKSDAVLLLRFLYADTSFFLKRKYTTAEPFMRV